MELLWIALNRMLSRIGLTLLSFLLMSCMHKMNNNSLILGNLKSKNKLVFLPNEVIPDDNYTCFKGAYYRKAVSSKDHWIGIKGEVTLPYVTFDSSRLNTAKPGQYLDNPSIYLGGNMDGQETDIGLTWEVLKYEDGSVSKERLAFRPFFRRTSHKSGQESVWVYAPASKEFYWYPGENVEMSIEVIKDGLVRFIVKGAGKYYEGDFECAGYTLSGIADFKRVNAIDQVRNEGKPAQPTKTKVEGAVWDYTTLIRMHDGKRLEVPMHNGRRTDMRCPEANFFSIKQSPTAAQKGAEVININGLGS
ncbi:hypothetical protein [Sphingobacterium rhinopitheci]|uniref:hypothetical protein n=1 Tax=Sphingobacterium rhinopitheci TaxID=2781960 RepID=UPI001F52321D|nr:hypothetical protein [Sphingobacterium rhinopitheci]